MSPTVRTRAAYAIGLALGAYNVYDAAVFRVSDLQRWLYAAVAGPVFLAALLLWKRAPLPGFDRRAVLAMLAVALLPLLAVPWQPSPVLTYVLGDVAMLLLPAAFLVVGAAVPGLFRVGPPLLALGALLLVAALLAPFVGRAETGRFIPPQALLLTMAWLAALWPGNRRRRAAAGVVVVLLVGLVILSGTRASMILACVTGLASAVLAQGRARGLRNGGLAVGAILLASWLTTPQQRAVALETMRMQTLAEGQLDTSLQTRVDEVADVAWNIGERWSPWHWPLGSGPGALWRIHESSPNAYNVQADGRVHQVHFTPAALLWRNGLLGVAGFAALGLLLLVELLRPRRPVTPEAALFRVALLAYMLDAGVHFVPADPLFSLSIAGLFLWRDPRGSAPPGAARAADA